MKEKEDGMRKMTDKDRMRCLGSYTIIDRQEREMEYLIGGVDNRESLWYVKKGIA